MQQSFELPDRGKYSRSNLQLLTKRRITMAERFVNHSGLPERQSGIVLQQETEIQFRRLLEKLPAGAYTCDTTGLITYYNQHAVRLWGRTPRLNDPTDRFCGSFKLFAADGIPISHDRCWM